jgi:tetratricopeptide (TPR) repeat protein
MLNTVKAEQAADSVENYGQKLFKQVFQTNFDAYSEYRQLRGKLNQVQIEIESQTPEFQALHWEAMRDPELPRPFGVDCVMLRKSTKPVPVSAYVQPSPVINLLVVTARPKEENDVGYRTISRSLIEAIEKCQLRVNVELLRPGTYEALERHLEEKGAGFYHIIHFDAHGGLMSYEQIQAGAKANRYLYQQRYGREDLHPFEGVKAFLFLEGETKGKADPIEAKELADLLTGKGIPVCILNACQSGKQLKTPPAPLSKGGEGQDDSLTPPLASRQGQDDSVTPPLASRQGQDDSVTPPLASRLGEDDSVTPPLASRLGEDECVTPPLASRLGQDECVTPPLASRQRQDESVTPPLASRQRQDESVTPPLASRQRQDESVTPPLARGVGGVNPDDARETSLGSRLMAAGMQMVVAMGYSVTVTAASLLMEKLYRELFDNKGITEALRLGRRELFNRKERKAYFNQTIKLEDWLLPVVYCNQSVNLNLREFTPQEEEKFFESLGSQYRFTQPEYGFVGRDLEILKIEKALLRHNILLLQGMGGTGKTTLLNYLREWWQTTHFTQDVFYFGYDQKAWTLQQILFEIGKRVYDRFEMSRFQAMNQAAQLQKLVAKLKTEPYILILDNLESVTGQRLAIQNTLSKKKQTELREFLALLVGGKTRVVLGSRSGEEWLQGTTFKTNIYHLQGLDPQSRSLLAEKILERHVVAHRISQIRDDAEFARLMKLLAGYPLAMEVVLANLKQQSPKEILEKLQAADVNLDSKRESGDKTESILKCVEYSHSNLSTDAQKLLLCLAPFSGFIDRSVIPYYVKQLQKLDSFKDYAFDKFDAAIQEAIDWGLLSGIDLSPSSPPQPPLLRGEQEEERLLTIQPVFPYFLKTKLATLDESTREALQEGFKNHYQGLAGDYNQLMESKDAQERQLGRVFCRLDYENLYNALKICLEKQESINIFFCLDKYFELINDIQSRLKLSEFVCQAQEAYPSELRTGEIGYEIVMALGRLATGYLETQKYQEARESCQKIGELLLQLSDVEERQKQSALATTYHQLGRVAEELREFEQAREYYQQALAITIEFGDRYKQADTYHQLGRVAEELREFEQAREYYQQALAITIEFGDRYEQAGTYHQLGRVAQQLREFEQAREYYQQALAVFIEFGDRYEQARTYHQLGRVAEELGEFEQAREYYQQALAVFIEFGDRYKQAIAYHQLGRVAEELREFEQAREYYQQALALFIEFGDRYKQASTYHQLGIVAQQLREFEQAREYYQQALALFIEFGDRYEQAGTYHCLGLLAEAQEDYAEARTNLQKALEIYIEYKDEYWGAIAREALERLPDSPENQD